MGNATTASQIKAFLELGKYRLSLLVLYSSWLPYLIAVQEFSVEEFSYLGIGGLLISMSANSFNQLIERYWDALMGRTAKRPLPSKRLRTGQAVVFGLLSGVLGFHLLAVLHPWAGYLALLSWVLYVLVYTPLKRVSAVAVWIGTLPGALPVLIGWFVAKKALDTQAWLLFLIQVFWQLPHFYTIAYLAYEDYQKAGFQLLPTPTGRSKSNAFWVAISHLPLVVIPFIGFYFELFTLWALGIIAVVAAAIAVYAYRFYQSMDLRFVKRLLYWDLLYLPLVFLLAWFSVLVI